MTTISQVGVETFVMVPDEDHFSGDYMDNPSMERIGKELIEEYPELGHLEHARIAYLWKKQGGTAGGRDTYGAAVKPNAFVKHFNQFDYIVWFAADHLREVVSWWDERKFQALVFHELSHCGIEITKTGAMKRVILPHDFEGFGNELRIFGRWNDALEIMHQATLPGVA